MTSESEITVILQENIEVQHKAQSFRLIDKIPAIFHNLKGYDSHLIMQEIGKFNMNISVIPNNLEKYMDFFLGNNLKFIDSLQFMNDSLEKLAKNIQSF